jgi:type I restriction-modification system DNA methylase subunit
VSNMSPQVKMLNDVMELIITEPTVTNEIEAFDTLLHIVAYELSYETMIQTPWMQQTILEKIRETLDLDLLRQDIWDWFGEIYELRIGKQPYFYSRDAVRKFVQTQPPNSHLPAPYTALDPNAGSGRLLLELANQVDGKYPAIYYGAEKDTWAYRMAILNFKLYDLNYRIVCMDASFFDTRSQSPNWKYANVWKPLESKKFFTEKEVTEMNVSPGEDPQAVYYF